MPTVGSERYRQHEVWQMISVRIEAFEAARYSTEALEEMRAKILEALRQADRSRSNPVPIIFDDVLDSLRDLLNSVTADEGQVQAFFLRQSGLSQLSANVRQLPGPPPRGISDRLVSALDSAIQARELELEELRSKFEELSAQVDTAAARLDSVDAEVTAQSSRIGADSATIAQVVSTAAERLEGEWQNRLSSWDIDRKAKDAKLDSTMAGHIQLLAGSALVGKRLVEHSAGLLTAKDWTSRAKRERLNATWLRWGAIASFVATVGAGIIILNKAITDGFDLSVGDGILRGALVLALGGIGAFLIREASRHFREANSSEEVALAITAIEPFYEGSSEEDRSAARNSLGDAVFVRNVLSRFTNRDAARHAASSNQEMSEMVEELAKAAIAKLTPPKA